MCQSTPQTYDQVLGDMKEADGDLSLVFFGESVAPNHHARRVNDATFEKKSLEKNFAGLNPVLVVKLLEIERCAALIYVLHRAVNESDC